MNYLGRFGAADMPVQEALDRLAAWHAALSTTGWKIAVAAGGTIIPCAIRQAHNAEVRTYMTEALAVFEKIRAGGAPYPTQKIYDMSGKFVKTVPNALPVSPLTFTTADCKSAMNGFGVAPVVIALTAAVMVAIIAVGKAVAMRIAGPAIPIKYSEVVDAYARCTAARGPDSAAECRTLIFGIKAPEAPWMTWLFSALLVVGVVGGGYYAYRNRATLLSDWEEA